jgi:hypothetical protein
MKTPLALKLTPWVIFVLAIYIFQLAYSTGKNRGQM